MFILFTSEENSSAEKEQLIHFFENGLPLLHVRKPVITEEEMKTWLSQFEEKHLQKMVLHQHHRLTEFFPVKGIHLKENFRSKQEDLAQYIEQFQRKGLTVSSSFHVPEEVKKEVSGFDYVFLSPVFTSVSKERYKGKEFNVEKLPHRVVALGGIEADKILTAKEMGYAGVAVLGAVWFAENKYKVFTEIFKKYRNVYA
ncbi:thiamine phosphate synthase [Salegentibacter salegens]|uniref:Thiamine-phosphate pyrophosphorylase n=1 Tax=Salegentibacter salegens TaxID=143223 RepID=A0A1M7J0P1_9FLAO|nr:thiamine phosphate synthase [Salegentibacter salegens]PRX49880.1 thiamine-phosphate pyrophosphorylase [Salegentibacter salegens]SHM46488.1 thiamine-phosphate pyrophosphorylase [Salegentibacter salegens]